MYNLTIDLVWYRGCNCWEWLIYSPTTGKTFSNGKPYQGYEEAVRGAELYAKWHKLTLAKVT